ncbi:recombinase RecT [Parasalinivibrio latis]|uniref:RecT family recombinase n=1 Tax=Parasalinivibrio latis TaxID=2952610 RepID=UPI0030E2C3E1
MTTQLTSTDTQDLAMLDAEASTPAYDVATMMVTPGLMGQLERFAQLMAQGKVTVPTHLRGSIGDCLAVTLQAMQWRMNPHAVAQKTHLVNGTLGYEAQLVNAVIKSMAPTKDRLEFEFFGPWEQVIGKFTMETSGKGNRYARQNWTDKDEEGVGVRVFATLRGENKPRVVDVLLKQCWPRNSTQWATDPQQQITYVAVKKWARRYCPDVILGVYTPDELELPPEKAINPEPAKTSKTTALLSRLSPIGGEKQEGATLDDVLGSIQAATTEAALAEVEDAAKALPPAALKTARKAYKDKLTTLRATNGQPAPSLEQEA